jgi:hypothetical protein
VPYWQRFGPCEVCGAEAGKPCFDLRGRWRAVSEGFGAEPHSLQPRKVKAVACKRRALVIKFRSTGDPGGILDGSPESAVALLTGVPVSEFNEYGGMPS